MKITIYNNKSEEIFTKEVAVTVDAPRDLKVEYLPSVIVPYVKNLGAAFVKDNDLNCRKGLCECLFKRCFDCFWGN